jgi:predicted enzyme related to lactoylglutathione lyase
MAKALGLGGIFFKSKDPTAMCEWYGKALGLPVDQWGASLKPGDMPDGAICQWSPFKMDTDYFDPAKQEFMMNFVVDDLEGVLKNVAAQGGKPVGGIQEESYGRFGWFLDPEGRKVELWQPAGENLA